jgi:hypothetical protein
MKYLKSPFSLTALLFLLLVQQGFTQRNPDLPKEDEKEHVPFKDRLWYGGNVSLGFSSFNGQSNFGFGLAPMVGYKFLGFLSAGPRVSVFLNSVKVSGYKAATLFNTEAGVFLRAKVFRGFFIQGELSNEWLQQPYIDNTTTIKKLKYTRGNQYLGAGYNFGNGEGGGSEIGIFYNFAVANDIESIEQPWDYRFGFTWNF